MPLHGFDAVFRIEDSVVSVPVGKLEMLSGLQGHDEHGEGIVMLVDLLVLICSDIVPALMREGEFSVADLDVVVDTGLVNAVIDFSFHLEIRLRNLVLDALVLPVIPLAVVFEVLLFRAPPEREVVLEGGTRTAFCAVDIVAFALDLEFGSAAGALVEHGLEAHGLVVSGNRNMLALLEVELVVGQVADDAVHDLVLGKGSGLVGIDYLLRMDADLALVLVGGPFGVAQSRALDAAGIDRCLEEPDHLGDGR